MPNAVTAFLDAHLDAGRGDRPAIELPSGTTTYSDLAALAGRAGNALRRAGVEPEQRVALLLPDGVMWAASFFGTLRTGAVAVPLNTRLGPEDWGWMLRDSRAKVLVAAAELLGAAAGRLGACPSLRSIFVAGATASAGAQSFEAALAAESPVLAAEPVSLDDMAFWLYTSGTTGPPKAVVHLHRDLLAAHHYGIDVLSVSAADRIFATSKLFFAYALGNALLIPLLVGARTWLMPAWSEPASVAHTLAHFRPTLFFSVPTFYARMLRSDLPRDAFASVRTAVSAGERLPEEIYWQWRERFGVEIVDGLGATETIFMVLSNRPGQSRAGSAGTPVPGTEARLLDAGGGEVAAGEPGVLHVRTPSAASGYWNRLDQSRQTFLGDWLRTGDVMTRDGDGFYYHAGREDDLFKVAGMWVAPTDVEAALLTHPDVAEAGVVGGAEEGGLIKAYAFVVPKDADVDRDQLVSRLAVLVAEKLPAHQRPRAIRVVDALPRTATGKLQRYALRAALTGAGTIA